MEKVDSVASNVTKILSSPKKRLSKSQDQAKEYLKEKNIFELFHFLMGHLLIDEPDQPIEYLAELLDKCINFKLGVDKPPVLFSTRHIESMFRSLDPAGLGSISFDQYKAGMTTLGVQHFNPNPKQVIPGRISKQVFVNEAKRCLVTKLAQLVGRNNVDSI